MTKRTIQQFDLTQDQRDYLHSTAAAARRRWAVAAFAKELRKWWSFDDRQMHTHSWHSREDFIERKLPELLAATNHADR